MESLELTEGDLESIKNRVIKGIRQFVTDSGAKGAVLGLSGGIDSGLVAGLAREALGSELTALIMPVKDVSNKEDIQHAEELARDLGIPYKVIELKPILDAFRTSLPDVFREGHKALPSVNLAPRIRMTLNYSMANNEDYIVLGTGNKTELMIGYFTKYGDGGVDVLPIGGLYKSQVRQLACHLGLPQCFVSKPPSAGLWTGQTDEEELGESYETLDMILFNLIEEKRSVAETARIIGIPLKRVERITGMIECSRHKLETPPILNPF